VAPETVFEFSPYFDALVAFGGTDGPRCDLRPFIWYGIRASAPLWHVDAVLGAADRARLRLSASEDLKSLGFDDEELAMAEGFRGKAQHVAELTAGPAAARKELILYFLLLMGAIAREAGAPKQAQSGVRTKVAPVAAPADPEVAAKFFDRAYLASQAGKLDIAQILLREGLEADPDHVGLASLRVWLRALRPDGQSELATQRAVAEMSAIIGAHDECAHAHFFRGQLYKRLGRHERAASDFREALQHDPKRVDAQAELRLCATRLRTNVANVKRR
jgi:tetratricopeptide (TPR) repeat protein